MRPGAARSVPTVKITNYGFDESDSFASVYVSENMRGVGRLPAENVRCTFDDQRVHLLVRELNGANHELVLSNLAGRIDAGGSRVRVKADRVVLQLRKAEPRKSWARLVRDPAAERKEQKRKGRDDDGPLGGDSGDPSAGIMGLMKEMYDEGDDEMKRVIAKAWVRGAPRAGRRLTLTSHARGRLRPTAIADREPGEGSGLLEV